MTIPMGRLRGVFTRNPLTRPRLPFIALLATAGAAGVLGACGGDDDDAAAPTNAGVESVADAGGDEPAPPAAGGDADEGAQLAQDYGCRSCHREGGGGIGPDWEGLYGSTVTLDDGSTVVADDAYLLESIVDPGAKKVDGYAIGMPVNDALGDDDIASIIAYIQSLGDAGAPSSS